MSGMFGSDCRCNLFEDKNFIVKKEFNFLQKETIFNKVLPTGQSSFTQEFIEYHCQWEKAKNFNKKLPALIICIKDLKDLLCYTLDNLYDNKVHLQSNIIIVDDRSSEDIHEIATGRGCSYLRVDNNKGFNFSMLNNIPAFIVNKLGCNVAVFWNSDLWVPHPSYFKKIIKKHRNSRATISGFKLVYPPEDISWSTQINDKNIILIDHGGEWRETVQFGGSLWVHTPDSPIKLSPIHKGRFSLPDDPEVNCDTDIQFVTGALMIVDLRWFISMGGFNPSLAKILQDTDLCLRAKIDNRRVMYFGKNIFFWHDESISFYSQDRLVEFKDKQYISDHYCFGDLWSHRLGARSNV